MKQKSVGKNLSLSPLSFDEAVTDILKIQPDPKAPKAKRKSSRPLSADKAAKQK